MSYFCYNESGFDQFNKWLDSAHETKSSNREFLESIKEEGIIELVEKAFLEGFESGRKRLAKENWDLWNQK